MTEAEYRQDHPATRVCEWGTAGVLLSFALLGVLCSLIVPLGEGIDEAAHFVYADYVRAQRRLPVQELYPGNRVIMGHHPPLYYALGALVISWADTSDLWTIIPYNPRFMWRENEDPGGWNVHLHSQLEAFPYAGAAQAFHVFRLFSLVLGVLALYVDNQIIRLLLPKRPWLALAGTALIAFNPGFVLSSSMVHHDPLQSLNFALGLWWMLGYVRRGGGWLQWLLAGLLASAAVMTKASGVALVASIGFALLVRSWREREWRPAMLGGAVVSGIVALLCGWWYLRNLALYGDLLGWDLLRATYPHVLRLGPYNWFFFWNEFIAQLGRNFWGGFGFMHILLPPAFRRVLWAMTLAGGVGLVTSLWRARGRLPKSGQVYAHLVALATLGFVFLVFFRGSFDIMGWGHGRYLFGVLGPFVAWICLGLDELALRRAQAVWGTVIPVGMLAYAIYAICVFLPPYYALPAQASQEVLSGSSAVHHVYGNGIELVGFDWRPNPAAPGGDATLCTYWQLAKWKGEDIRVKATLRDRLGSPLGASVEFWPVDNGFPPNGWEPGVAYVDCRSFYVPANAYTGRSSVLVERIDPQTEDAIHEGVPAPVLPVAIGKRVEYDVGADLVVIVQLGEQISLVGFDAPLRVRAGQDLALTLYWQTDSPVEENYVVFVQVLNADGFLVAQKDNEPGDGQSPTSIWEPGQVVADSFAVPIPGGLSPGEHRIIVGMYTWPAIERLPVRIGNEVVGDYVDLTRIEIRDR